MTVAAGYRLPVFSGSAFPEFGPGTGFRPLVEPPAKPLEDRLPEEMTAVERALVEARSEFEAVRAADLAEFERRLEEREQQALATVADALSGQLTAGLGRIEARDRAARSPRARRLSAWGRARAGTR